MPYLRGSLAKECLVTLSTSDKCSKIRCYAKRVGGQYLSEGAKAVGVATGTVLGSAGRCVMKPPKTFVGGTLCVAGTLLTTCAVLPTPAAPYCASAASIAFYGASKL